MKDSYISVQMYPFDIERNSHVSILFVFQNYDYCKSLGTVFSVDNVISSILIIVVIEIRIKVVVYYALSPTYAK